MTQPANRSVGPESVAGSSALRHERAPFDLSFPVRGVPASTQLEVAVAAERLGWRGVWCSELFGLDALVMLGAIAARTSKLHVGAAAVPATTRSAAVLAMGASTLAHLAPGRAVLGIGASTPAVVRDRHDRAIPTVDEFSGIVRVVRNAVRGDRVSHNRSPRVNDLRIEPARIAPRVFLAAVGPRLTQVAISECDGLLLNMVPFPDAVARATAAQQAAGRAFETALLVRTQLDPTGDDLARLRAEVAGYLRVPAYAKAVAATGIDIAAVIAAPDLRAAAMNVSDDLLDRFVVAGDADTCAAKLARLQESGLRVLVVPPADLDSLDNAIRSLAPLA